MTDPLSPTPRRHKRDCPFAQRVILDIGYGPSPSCICGPCPHPSEYVRPGMLTGDPFCDFCKTLVPKESTDD